MTGTAAERVLVLHGLWMHAPIMHWFGRRLRASGFDARTLGYFSVMESTEAALARIRAALLEAPGTHVVAHSLGGLLSLRAVAGLPPGSVGRVVCLGAPLAGSRAASDFSRRRGGRMIGQHLDVLLQGCGQLPPEVEVGEIAGRRPLGLGRVIANLEGPNDGTVALSETCVPGLCDYIVIDASHGGMMFSTEAVRQSACFLRQARFDHGQGTEAMRAIA